MAVSFRPMLNTSSFAIFIICTGHKSQRRSVCIQGEWTRTEVFSRRERAQGGQASENAHIDATIVRRIAKTELIEANSWPCFTDRKRELQNLLFHTDKTTSPKWNHVWRLTVSLSILLPRLHRKGWCPQSAACSFQCPHTSTLHCL